MPKLYNQSNASNEILGYAYKQYSLLDQIRNLHRLGILRKAIPLPNNIFIYLTASEQGSILISGGYPDMLLAGNSVSAYSYKRDALSSAKVDWKNDLFPMFNGRIQQNDIDYTQYLSGWTNGKLEGGGGTPLGTLPSYELGFFSSNNSIYARHDNSIFNFGNIASQASLVPEFCSSYGSLFNATYRLNGEYWNQLSTDVVYIINPINKKRFDSYYWTPNLFSVAPADPYKLSGGFYYGKYPSPQYGFVDSDLFPLITAEIHLKGFLDTRFINGSYSYGYSELVTMIENVGGIKYPNDLYIFAQGMPLSSEPNSYFYNESSYGDMYSSKITIGWEGHGKNWIYKISLDNKYNNPKVDLWNFACWQNTDSIFPQDPDSIGLVVSSGKNAFLYCCGGYTTSIYETSNYHSHTRSNDGSLVAIFEGAEFIESVRVYDLFGKRDPEKDGEYLSGGYTEVRVSETVASVEAMEGVFIPFRTFKKADIENIQEGIEILSTAGIDSSDLGNYMDDSMPSMSILSYNKDGASPLKIEKVSIKNGIAKYEVTDDSCFESVIITDDPKTQDKNDKLISTWDVGGSIYGHIRGNFTGELNQRRFNGIGSGSKTTLPSTFSMRLDKYSPYNNIIFDGVVGDLLLGSCVEETENGIVLSDSCLDNSRCGEDITATATSSCGQSGTLHYSVDVSELTISGDRDLYVDNIYGASGGSGPYSWNCSAQYTVSESTQSIRITDTNGLCGVIIVSVTDHCGTTVNYETRASGHWVLQSDGGDPPWYDPWVISTIDSGGTRIVQLYTTNGCLVFENQIFTVTTGYCSSPNIYSFNGPIGEYWLGPSSGMSEDETCHIESAPNNRYDVPNYSGYHAAAYDAEYFCTVNTGSQIDYYAYKMCSHDPQYDKFYTWECK